MDTYKDLSGYTPPVDEVTPSGEGINADVSISNDEPIERDNSLTSTLDALSISEGYKELPQDAQEQIEAISNYAQEVLKKSGQEMTIGNMKKTIEGLKEEVGLPEGASPDTVIERLGNVINSWRMISFIPDMKARRSVFMQLAKADSASKMNEIVFKSMDNYKVWR